MRNCDSEAEDPLSNIIQHQEKYLACQDAEVILKSEQKVQVRETLKCLGWYPKASIYLVTE